MRGLSVFVLLLMSCHTTTPKEPTKPKEKTSGALFLQLCALRSLACYDANKGDFATESQTCQQLVSAGGPLASATQQYTIKGPGEACDNASMLKGLATNEPANNDGLSEAVVWPASLHFLYAYDTKKCGDLPGAKCYPAPTPKEQAALSEAVFKSFPLTPKGAAVVVSQSIPLDIDGDGKVDRLYSIFVTNNPENGSDSLQGDRDVVLWAKGQEVSQLQAVTSIEGGLSYWLSAAVDLNADDRPELFFSGSYGADYTFDVFSFNGESFRSVLVNNEAIPAQ